MGYLSSNSWSIQQERRSSRIPLDLDEVDVRRDIWNTIFSLKEDLKNHFNKEHFHNLYEKVRSIDLHCRNVLEERYFWRRQLRDVIFSLKKDLEFLCHKEDFQELHNNVGLIMDSLLKDHYEENYSPKIMSQYHNQIRDMALKATNLIFCKSLECVPVGFDKFDWKTFSSAIMEGVEQSFDATLLPKITQEIICINEELKIHNDSGPRKKLKTTEPHLWDPTATPGESSALSNPSRRSPMKVCEPVGLKEDLTKMLDCLIGGTLNFQVFPVIGIAGIGKTTFAEELYHHPYVMHHFDIRAWVTVSQEFNQRQMLLSLLGGIPNLSNEIIKMNEHQLRELLRRSLMGKRYFIVLDDVWDEQVWADFGNVFPKDNSGSRALLTSRLRSVAIEASPKNPPHCLQFLSPEESWELLSSKIFINESPPMELVSIGKQIAHKCRGLPLAVVVIGGLLSKKIKSSEVWEEVYRNIGSMVMNDTQDCQSILALSYSHLPNPLKACLLYMGVFPEDYEISSKKLMNLWIAEGFLQPNEQKELEDVAEDYLEELIARCIILVKRRRSNGKVKTCHIHDLMRAYCLKESRNENFLHVIHGYGERSLRNTADIEQYYKEFLEKDLHNLQRLSFVSNICEYMKIKASFPFTRSFFCFEVLRPTELKGFGGILLKKLKILDIMHAHLPSLPHGILLLSNLKFLSLTIVNSVSLSELSHLPRLQTCIINDGELIDFSFSIFQCMTELRHIHFRRIIHAFDGGSQSKLGNTYLPNLHSLSTVSSSCCESILQYLHNLGTLAVYGTEEDNELHGWFKDLVHLRQLKTLKYTFSNPFASPESKPEHLPPFELFPPNLMKLTLSGTSFPWEDMQQLSQLPKLEVLKLNNYAFSGAVWRLEEQSFDCLKFLLIGSTNLEVWEADGSHFPSLEHLVLRHCKSLKEIPYGIGDAALLEKIELHCCSESAATSARELEKEQESLGNDLLTVFITQR